MVEKLYENLIIFNLIIVITFIFSILEMAGYKFSKALKRIYMLIYSFVVIIYGSKTNISGDFESYKFIFTNAEIVKMEFVYKKIAYLCNYEYTDILIFIIGIQMIVLYNIIHKERYMFTLIYLYSIFNLYEAISLLRHSLALAILFLGLKYINTKKGKIFVFLSLFFHNFIFFNIMLLVVPPKKKYNKKFFLFLGLLIICLGIGSKHLMEYLIKNVGYFERYAPYIQAIELNFYGKIYRVATFFMENFILIYIFYKGMKILKNDQRSVVFFNQIVYGSLISFFFIFSGMSYYIFDRILFSVNRSIFYLLIIIMYHSDDKKKIYKEILLITIIYLVNKNIQIYLIRYPLLSNM